MGEMDKIILDIASISPTLRGKVLRPPPLPDIPDIFRALVGFYENLLAFFEQKRLSTPIDDRGAPMRFFPPGAYDGVLAKKA